VSATWAVVAVVGVATLAFKAVGPVLLGGKPLPDRAAAVVTLLGPALLSALVAIGTFGDGRSLVLDARVPGVLAAAVAIRLRAPVLLVVIVAAAVTATIRAIGS
jgi:branched-subunit amino acid transport protein